MHAPANVPQPSIVIATPAATAHCSNLKLGVVDTGPVAAPKSAREPVTHLEASGLSCAAATKLFRGAKVTVAGGGGNLGTAFGAKGSMAPTGWKCTYIVGYWTAKDHADTLDWIGGWGERCVSGARVVRFDEGKITPYRLSPSAR